MAEGQQKEHIGFHWHLFVRKEKIQEYRCGVCQRVLDNPQQIVVCGHQFCKLCLPKVVKKCPTCNQDVKEDEVFSDESIRLKISSLDVRCPDKQCIWKGPFKDFLEQHQTGCPSKLAACQNERCGQQVAQRDLAKHQNEECEYRKIDCAHCKEAITPEGQKTHEEICQHIMLNCPNECKNQIPREKLQEHVDKECEKTLVDCIFKSIGCQQKVERGKFEDHIKTTIQQHLNLTLLALIQTNTEKQQLKDEFGQLRDEMKTLGNKNQHLETQNDALSEEFKSLTETQSEKHNAIDQKIDEITATVEQQLESLQKAAEQNFESSQGLVLQYGKLSDLVGGLRMDIGHLNESTVKKHEQAEYQKVLTGTHAHLTNKIGELKKTMEQFQSLSEQRNNDYEETRSVFRETVNKSFHQLDKAIDKNRNDILKQKTNIVILKDGYDEKFSKVSQQMKSDYDNLYDIITMEEQSRSKVLEIVEDDVQRLQAVCHSSGNFVWKVENVDSLLKSALGDSSEAITGPIFCSEPYGYQMQLKVFFNGARVGDSSHVSLFVKLHPGPYDAILGWPFKQRMRFSLIDQGNTRHDYSKEFVPVVGPEELERPTFEANNGYGIYKFANHRKLKEYVCNDTLFIRVDVSANENGRHSETI